jgi:hypothetical protein
MPDWTLAFKQGVNRVAWKSDPPVRIEADNSRLDGMKGKELFSKRSGNHLSVV